MLMLLRLGLLFFTLTLPLEAASRLPVSSAKGLVATTNGLASEVGADILRKGGTAADAAVAVGFALAVTWPSAGNLGGGGFALVYAPDGTAEFVDYRETAPLAASESFYQNEKGEVDAEASRKGYRAMGIPGTVAGLAFLHKKYGKLPWKGLLEPARRLAADGFLIDEHLLESLGRAKSLLEAYPESKRIFLNDGRFWKLGDRLKQPDLARSIALLQKKGAQAFYEGDIAKAIATDVKAHGGVLSLADFKAYQVESRKPLERSWKSYQVITAPPPSSGGTVMLAMLGMLEQDDLKSLGFGSAAYLHLLIEAMKRGFADRSQWYGDPAFVANPTEKLLDPKYLAERRKSIAADKASKNVEPAQLPDEKLETTHYTIRDKNGMIISNTYTLNGGYGAGVVAKGTGILLNNEMDDFAAKSGSVNMFGLKQGTKNLIAPKKRPLSSMTPTIVLEKGKAVLALGSPGGPTIINSVSQVLLNRLLFGMSIQEAVDAPRIHHQWFPDRVMWDPNGINPDTRRILDGMGHIFADAPRFFGDVQALAFDPESGLWTGASDPRNGGEVAAE